MSRPSVTERQEWRRMLVARAHALKAAGHQVEWVDAPEHPMGCYLRTSARDIRVAHVAAMTDRDCPFEYRVGKEVVLEEDRTNVGQYATVAEKK